MSGWSAGGSPHASAAWPGLDDGDDDEAGEGAVAAVAATAAATTTTRSAGRVGATGARPGFGWALYFPGTDEAGNGEAAALVAGWSEYLRRRPELLMKAVRPGARARAIAAG